MFNPHTFFTNMVDELVEFSKDDPELAEGLKWIDTQAQKKGVSFYEMVFIVLHKKESEEDSQNWINTRN